MDVMDKMDVVDRPPSPLGPRGPLGPPIENSPPNAALVPIAVACSLLDRQIASLAAAFAENGGFTERLYRVRTQRRGYGPPQ